MPPAIYLDNAATSFPKPDAVLAAVDAALRHPGSAGRGVHGGALHATQAVGDYRAGIAAFFGIRDPRRLVFTAGATDALNMAIKGLLRPGDHAVTTVLEHNAVLRPLCGLEQRGVIGLTVVPASREGYVSPTAIAAALRPETRLVVLTHASNVLGTVQPVRQVALLCQARGIPCLVDAAQTGGELDIDIDHLGADLVAFAGHKALLGPPGIGCLYVRDGLTPAPWREGGSGADSAAPLQPVAMPEHLEAGTPNLPAIAGLAAGMRYLNEHGMRRLFDHRMALVRRLVESLADDARFTLYGSRDWARRVPVQSLGIDGMDAAEVGIVLDHSFGIAVRTGLHCAARTHTAIDTLSGGTVRVSPGVFTQEGDIDRLIAALREIADGIH